MRDLIRALVLVVGISIAIMTAAPALAGKAPSYEAEIEQFMKRLQKKEGGDAIEDLLGGNPWIAPATLEPLRRMIASYPTSLGELVGWETLDVTTAGDCYAVISVLARFERQPLTIEFRYYRADDTWMPFGVETRPEWTTEVGEKARARVIEKSATSKVIAVP